VGRLQLRADRSPAEGRNLQNSEFASHAAWDKEIAAGIPGAKFVPLESRNHVILADEPANRQFFECHRLVSSK
jgi:hypothetical protein